MKYVYGLLSVIAAIGVALLAAPAAGSTGAAPSAARSVPLATTSAATASVAAGAATSAPPADYPIEVVRSVSVPSAAPATAPVTAPVTATSTPAPAAAAPAVDTRTAYIDAMYVAVVPARQRAALAGRYVLGYDLPGMTCGTGCTGVFSGQARSSFDAEFFTEAAPYQRNILAHEAAHAYGFLTFAGYATPDWTAVGGWQAQFHAADRSFAGTYDAEAWASCVAWQESGFNNLVNEISHVCTSTAAALAVAQIA